MTLLYLIASLAGVALLVGLNIAMFGRGQRNIDPQALTLRLASEWPGFRPGAFALTPNGSGALMEGLADGSLHLAIMRGDSLVTRKLQKNATQVACNNAMLSFCLADFTIPRVALDFADAAIASDWEGRIARAMD